MSCQYPYTRTFLEFKAKEKSGRGIGSLDVVAAKAKCYEWHLREIVAGAEITLELARKLGPQVRTYAMNRYCDCGAQAGDAHAFDCPGHFAETNHKLAGIVFDEAAPVPRAAWETSLPPLRKPVNIPPAPDYNVQFWLADDVLFSGHRKRPFNWLQRTMIRIFFGWTVKKI